MGKLIWKQPGELPPPAPTCWKMMPQGMPLQGLVLPCTWFSLHIHPWEQVLQIPTPQCVCSDTAYSFASLGPCCATKAAETPVPGGKYSSAGI